MKNVCDCSNVHMIGTDGGLRHIPPYLVGELSLQGFKRVDNPKRTYYPEYDLKSPAYQKEQINPNDDDEIRVTVL